MKKYQGAIFDFNGTLFWDTHYHDEAWDIFLADHHLKLTNEEKHRKIHGKTNQDIFNLLFGNKLSINKINELIETKEQIYRTLCLANEMSLAPGAEQFLDWLKDKEIPFTIATASGIENVSFYFEQLPLSRWFKLESIVYNDHSFQGKPKPDIFLKAAGNLGISPNDVIVFEDSAMGILGAERANIGKIIIVNSNGEDYSSYSHEIIRDFTEIDKDLF